EGGDAAAGGPIPAPASSPPLKSSALPEVAPATAAADAPAIAPERILIGAPIALTWVDPAAAAAPRPAPELALTASGPRPPDLLAGRRRRALRPGTVVPPVVLLLLVAVYAA
ncbi:hypothetical protein ACWTQZ_25665, partial [Escherichia coli]